MDRAQLTELIATECTDFREQVEWDAKYSARRRANKLQLKLMGEQVYLPWLREVTMGRVLLTPEHMQVDIWDESIEILLHPSAITEVHPWLKLLREVGFKRESYPSPDFSYLSPSWHFTKDEDDLEWKVILKADFNPNGVCERVDTGEVELIERPIYKVQCGEDIPSQDALEAAFNEEEAVEEVIDELD